MSLPPLPPATMDPAWRRWFQDAKKELDSVSASVVTLNEAGEITPGIVSQKLLAHHVDYPSATSTSLGAIGEFARLISKPITVGETKRLIVTAWFVFDRNNSATVPTFEFRVYLDDQLKATETAQLRGGLRDQNAMAFEFNADPGSTILHIDVGSTTTASVDCFAQGTFALIEELERV